MTTKVTYKKPTTYAGQAAAVLAKLPDMNGVVAKPVTKVVVKPKSATGVLNPATGKVVHPK